MTTERYHASLRLLHWLMAFLLLGMFLGGKIFLDGPKNVDPMTPVWLRVHLIIGGALLVLLGVRVVIKLRTPAPPPAVTGIALFDRLAPVVHWGLYLIPLVVIASGIALSVQADLIPILFLGEGELPRGFRRHTASQVHEIAVTVLLVAAILHVLAALYHHFIRRDGLLRRMW